MLEAYSRSLPTASMKSKIKGDRELTLGNRQLFRHLPPRGPIMTEIALQTAIWTPGWYELDQSLALNQRQKYWFFQNPPVASTAEASVDESAGPIRDLVFYNQLDSSTNCCVRYARIVEMYHPQLGPLQRVDTDGLDYIFTPVDGEEIIVNAEEDPGATYDPELSISDWSVLVKLSEVSDPMSELA
jgi:hypothetical protein